MEIEEILKAVDLWGKSEQKDIAVLKKQLELKLKQHNIQKENEVIDTIIQVLSQEPALARLMTKITNRLNIMKEEIPNGS